MNHKKLLLTLTLCLCALLCMVVTASASEVQGHSSHPVCGATHTNIGDHTEDKCSTPTWTKLYMDGDGKLCYGEGQQVTYDSAFDYYKLPAGTYYLGTDLTLNRGIQINSNGGDVTLCLNGKMISCGTGAAIQVKGVNNKNITFTLCDCEGSGVITHTGNDENDKGGNGVDVANSNNGGNNEVAKFIMYNGHITKNKGSGVYLNDSTSFTMYGGRITQNGYNNTSLFGGYGGGVYVASEASFTMYGGNITGNYADKNGGGVYVGSETANFTMSGGSITGNHTAGSGGGVNVNAGTITVGGNVNISGNWKGNENSSISNNNANNVYLPTNSTITIEKALTGAPIGITTANAPTAGNPVTIVTGNSIEETYKARFQADNAAYGVSYNSTDKVLQLHKHSGGTATCKANAVCTTCGQSYGNIDRNNHDIEHHEAKAATCTEVGWNAYNTCKREGCSYTTYKEIAALDHDMKNHDAQSPTCTETGHTAYRKCDRSGCNYKEGYELIPKLNHVFANTWEHNDDKHWHKCTRDGCTGIDAEAAHEWQPATYTAPKTCKTCGATQGEPLTRSYYYYAPSAAEDKKDSPKAGDPGVLLYAGLALASLTGLACAAKKRH